MINENRKKGAFLNETPLGFSKLVKKPPTKVNVYYHFILFKLHSITFL